MSEPLTPDTQSPTDNSPTQRILAILLLLVAGVLSLPVTAYFFDDQDNENYILPAALVGIAVVGFVVGYLLPGLAGSAASRGRGGLVGAVVGVVMALIGTVVFFLLIAG